MAFAGQCVLRIRQSHRLTDLFPEPLNNGSLTGTNTFAMRSRPPEIAVRLCDWDFGVDSRQARCMMRPKMVGNWCDRELFLPGHSGRIDYLSTQ